MSSSKALRLRSQFSPTQSHLRPTARLCAPCPRGTLQSSAALCKLQRACLLEESLNKLIGNSGVFLAIIDNRSCTYNILFVYVSYPYCTAGECQIVIEFIHFECDDVTGLLYQVK